MADASFDIGDAAPEFTLNDQNGNAVTLSGLKGQWVVLYFYPKDDTPGCTKEACQFTESIDAFADLNAKVFGVSPDNEAKHQKFIDKYDLKVDLLCDPEKSMMAEYGAFGPKKLYGKETIGVIRSTVIVDPEGNVAHRWKSVKADGHAEKVRERLESLQKA